MPKKEKYTQVPAVIDIETTGLYPEKNSVVEIAVVIYDAKTLQPTSQRFHRYVKPDPLKEIDPVALEHNKIDLTSIPESNTQERIKDQLLHWISEQGASKIKLKPLGHNYIIFDILFLKEWLGSENYENNFHYRATDTCLMARILKDAKILPTKSCSLKDICEYYNIPEPPHSALEDALATLNSYSHLLNELHPAAGFWRGLEYYLPEWVANILCTKFRGS